jgi:molybdopterin-guanine dinucleotide biosynthesis protein A
MKLASVILAGGFSRRMGRPKTGVEIEGVTLLRRIVDALRTSSGPVVVVARGPDQPLHGIEELVDAGVVTVAFDHAPGSGPLAGLASALSEREVESSEFVFVCGCDHPFLDEHTISHLLAELGPDDAAVMVATSTDPRSEDRPRPQPLTSLWRTAALRSWARSLVEAGEERLSRIADSANVRRIAPETLPRVARERPFWLSTDDPAAIERARELLASERGASAPDDDSDIDSTPHPNR